MGIEEKQENISKLEESLENLKRKEQINDDTLTKIQAELMELRQEDKLDVEIEKFPVDKLKNFQKDYEKINDSLKCFNEIVERYKNMKKN